MTSNRSFITYQAAPKSTDDSERMKATCNAYFQQCAYTFTVFGQFQAPHKAYCQSKLDLCLQDAEFRKNNTASNKSSIKPGKPGV